LGVFFGGCGFVGLGEALLELAHAEQPRLFCEGRDLGSCTGWWRTNAPIIEAEVFGSSDGVLENGRADQVLRFRV
jgi:hypothetical protein